MTKRRTHEEIAAEYDQLMAEGREFEGLVPVKARVSKDPRSVYSVRLRFEELSEIMKAADARGLTTSEFMRLASLSAASGEIDLRAGEQRERLLMIRDTAEQLYHAVQELNQADTDPRR
jgi:hypothetical protein